VDRLVPLDLIGESLLAIASLVMFSQHEGPRLAVSVPSPLVGEGTLICTGRLLLLVRYTNREEVVIAFAKSFQPSSATTIDLLTIDLPHGQLVLPLGDPDTQQISFNCLKQ